MITARVTRTRRAEGLDHGLHRGLDPLGRPLRKEVVNDLGEVVSGIAAVLPLAAEGRHQVRGIAEQIAATVGKVEVAIVVGGGNFFRGAELSASGMDRSRADYMGMLGTVMNCLALQDFLEQAGVDTRVQSAIPMATVCEPLTVTVAVPLAPE